MNVCVVGIGNCASAFVQGLQYYRNTKTSGLCRQYIGKYEIKDIHIKLAFDVDTRKVGKRLGEAIFMPPNCTPRYTYVPDGPVVQMGHIFDGVGPVMKSHSDKTETFVVDNITKPADVVSLLKEHKIDILNKLPPGGLSKSHGILRRVLS